MKVFHLSFALLNSLGMGRRIFALASRATIPDTFADVIIYF